MAIIANLDDLIAQSIASNPDVKGADGKSAYQIWIEAGNTGSEEDFLSFLQGLDGAGALFEVNGTTLTIYPMN